MLRIGLLGAAWISPTAIIKPAGQLTGVEVTAIAARDPERAHDYATEHAIPHIESSYEALLARDDIDLVYIALPISLHAQWASLALRAGKHVLCEKPLVMNAPEARELERISLSTGKYLIEAFHYKHHPYFKRIQQIVASGELGEIQQLSGRLHVPVPPREGQIRHDPLMGGGALMDLGCYPLHMLRTLCGEEPEIRHAQTVIGPTGVDLSIQAELTFSNGASGLIDCAMPETGELQGELIIQGDLGRLHASKPILPHLGGVLKIDSALGKREEAADTRSTFFFQLEAISKIIREAPKTATGIADSIGNAVALDAIRTAANF